MVGLHCGFGLCLFGCLLGFVVVVRLLVGVFMGFEFVCW